MKKTWLIPITAIFIFAICLIFTGRNDIAVGQDYIGPANLPVIQEADGRTVETEAEYIIGAGNNADIDAVGVNTIPAPDPIDNEPEIPPSSPAVDESVPGSQPGSGNEDEDSSDNQVEPQYIIHYVDREVIKEIVVEKPVTLGPFSSLDELNAWLATDDTNEYIHLSAGNNGVCQPSDRFDCDDYAFQLQQRAANSGFLISATIIKRLGKSHMINLACIGDDIYYIEPQSDEVWFFCKRD
jgi:hypothetical protein